MVPTFPSLCHYLSPRLFHLSSQRLHLRVDVEVGHEEEEEEEKEGRGWQWRGGRRRKGPAAQAAQEGGHLDCLSLNYLFNSRGYFSLHCLVCHSLSHNFDLRGTHCTTGIPKREREASLSHVPCIICYLTKRKSLSMSYYCDPKGLWVWSPVYFTPSSFYGIKDMLWQ